MFFFDSDFSDSDSDPYHWNVHTDDDDEEFDEDDVQFYGVNHHHHHHPILLDSNLPIRMHNYPQTTIGKKRTFDEISVWEEAPSNENLVDEFEQLQDKIINARMNKRIRLSLGFEEDCDESIDSQCTDDLNDFQTEEEVDVREIPKDLTEDIIRAYSFPSHFAEALDFIHCVQAITLRKNGKLKANIMKSSTSTEILAKCSLRFKGKYVVERSCTACASTFQNPILWCQHIVAVLLKCIRSPESVLFLETFNDVVKEAEKEEFLSEAIINIMKGNPSLMHQLIKEIDKLRKIRKGKNIENGGFDTSAHFDRPLSTSELEESLPVTKFSSGHYFDESKVFEAVFTVCNRFTTGSSQCSRATCPCRCHHRTYYDSSDEEEECSRCYSYGGRNFSGINEVTSSYLACATRMIEKGDAEDLANGLKIIENVGRAILTLDMTTMNSYAIGGSNTPYDQYDTLIRSLSAGVQTAMLQSEDKVSEEQRDHWIELLPNWNAILSAMTMQKSKVNFQAALDAAKNGWQSELIQRVLNGDEEAIKSFSEADDIIETRLKVLMARKDIQKACNYARAVGRILNACVYLLAQGQFMDALAYASKYVTEVETLASICIAAMVCIELSLDPQANIQEKMIEFLNHGADSQNNNIAPSSSIDERKVVNKQLDFLLGLPTKRQELVTQTKDQLSDVQSQALVYLLALYDCTLSKFEKLEVTHELNLVPFVTQFTEPFALSKVVFGKMLRGTTIVEISERFHMIVLMLDLFESRRADLYDYFSNLLQDSVADANMLMYIAMWFAEKHHETDKAFKAGLKAFEKSIHRPLAKWFGNFASTHDKEGNYLGQLTNSLLERKCTSAANITELIECSKDIARSYYRCKISIHAVRQSFKLAFSSGVLLKQDVFESCAEAVVAALAAPAALGSPEAPIDEFVSIITSELGSASIRSGNTGKYVQNEFADILDLLMLVSECFSRTSFVGQAQKRASSAYAIIEVCLDMLEIGSAMKPIPADIQQRHQRNITLAVSSFSNCYCQDCSSVINWLRSPTSSDFEPSKTLTQLTCFNLKNMTMSRIPDLLQIERHNMPLTLTITKKPALVESSRTIRAAEQFRRFEQSVSRRVIIMALSAARDADSAIPMTPSREDQVLMKVQTQNSTNYAILQQVLDFLLVGQRYERAIQLANRILELPNDSFSGTQDTMRKLIKASKKQALEHKNNPARQTEYLQMRDQCLQLARKNFLVAQTVEDFDKVKKLLAKFGFEQVWDTVERVQLLTVFLNEVLPENTVIQGGYSYGFELPKTIRLTFHLLIRDSYIEKSSEILEKLIKRHESSSQAENICSRLFDLAFSCLAKYRIDQSLIYQYFGPITKYYCEKWLKVQGFDTTTSNYNSHYSMTSARMSTSSDSNLTADIFWTYNSSTSSFEKFVIEKWCVPMMPTIAAWLTERKLTDWLSTINSRRNGYSKVVSCMMKLKKCYEQAGRPKQEWDKFKQTYSNTKGIKTKKKLVNEINFADREAYNCKTQIEQQATLKKVQDEAQRIVV